MKRRMGSGISAVRPAVAAGAAVIISSAQAIIPSVGEHRLCLFIPIICFVAAKVRAFAPSPHIPRRGDAEGAVCRGAKAVALKAFVTFARELLI